MTQKTIGARVRLLAQGGVEEGVTGGISSMGPKTSTKKVTEMTREVKIITRKEETMTLGQ
jgi:hypothetical protein